MKKYKFIIIKIFYNYFYLKMILLNIHSKYLIGDWGLGIGDWGLGIGPNPQSPSPNPLTNNNNLIN